MHNEKIESLTAAEALRLVKDTVFDSMGCTEPAAIAYAATAAYAHLGGREIRRVDCTISVSVFKNAMAVGIPGSDRSGIDFAVALGITAGDWKRGLELFSSARPVDIEKAARMADEGIVRVNLYEGDEKFYIHTTVETEKGSAEARIRHRHEALEWVDVNGARMWEAASGNGDTDRSSGKDGSTAAASSRPKTEKNAGTASCRSDAELTGLLIRSSAQELIDLADAMTEEELQELTEGVDINIRAAEYGLESAPGMGLGAGVAAIASEQEGQVSLASTVQQYVAAAVDTRMSGAMIPIKGCGGSGNHGITFFLTLGLGYRRSEERAVKSLARTLAFGLLLVRYFKGYTGLLSPTCGVTVSAAPAAAAALLYAFGGGAEEVTAAVKLIEGNLAGILCDGAKQGCALKSATSGRTAIETFQLVRRGVRIPSTDGIVGRDLPESMAYLRELQEQGLRNADKTMLNILLRKSGA
jgi:L-cysteine desulfidase